MKSKKLEKMGFRFLPDSYLEEEMTWIEFRWMLNGVERISKRIICPECINHPQEETTRGRDCKNTYGVVIDGKFHTKGQCCCYSPAHESG